MLGHDKSRKESPRWRWGEPVEPLLRTLGQGGVLAIPTESSYGLAVDPANAAGVEAIYRIKERQRDKPLPVVVGNLEQAAALGVPLDHPGVVHFAALWPAALTLVVPTTRDVPAAAGRGALAFRIPDHPRLRTLLQALGTGLTATSANLSGQQPLTEPGEVAAFLAEWGGVVIDDGPLAGGLPSTVVGWQEGRLQVMRQGRYPMHRIVTDFSAEAVEIAVDNSL